MRIWMLAAVSATVLVQLIEELPATSWLYPLGLLALGLTLYPGFKYLPRMAVAGLLAGFFWASLNAHQIVSERLPFEQEGKTLEAEGWVVSLPVRTERGWKFRFRIEQIDSESADWYSMGDCLLSWYGEEKIQAGEKWRLKVRLTRPHGSVNPGLFDYEGWLFQQGISATGYVRSHAGVRLGQSVWVAPHNQLRNWLREKLLAHLSDSAVRGLIIALVIGESAQISSAQWQILSATGTNHLLIISGFHIGLVTGGFLILLQCLGAGIRNSVIFSLFFALFYAALAGFGLPVQRALFMTAMALSGYLLARHTQLFSLYLFSLFCVVLLEPFASLSTGFWLSFGAVFVLLFAFSSRYRYLIVSSSKRPVSHSAIEWIYQTNHALTNNGPMRYLRQLVMSQWVIMVGLFPFLLFNVSQFSLISMIANLVALPWVGLLCIPLLLISVLVLCVCEPLGVFLLKLSDDSISSLWSVLEWMANPGFVYYPTAFSFPVFVLAIVGSLLWLVPKGLGIRWLGSFLLLPMLFPHQDQLEYGRVRVTTLDVGQGLAILVRTRNHRLLYDAGPKFSDRFDAGERIVLPFIRRESNTPLDMMVISHGDADHAGGAQAIIKNYLVREIRSSESFPWMDRLDCSQVGKWIWDGVELELFRLVQQKSKNNESCVLIIRAGSHHLIIPGDIEVEAERQLVRQEFSELFPKREKNKFNVLLAPHHGSSTSSSPAFLNAFKPDWVVISAGYLNRFGHPHKQVLQRYQARNINYLNTADSGAIEIVLGGSEGIRIQTARHARKRLWYDG